mmetsp:Transcript_34184/g.56597  ORF Transcript_34184/g.56597 Transcript_34184/m.56597 type:complete len:282 (-) Transcript_34184:148-993(-)
MTPTTLSSVIPNPSGPVPPAPRSTITVSLTQPSGCESGKSASETNPSAPSTPASSALSTLPSASSLLSRSSGVVKDAIAAAAADAAARIPSGEISRVTVTVCEDAGWATSACSTCTSGKPLSRAPSRAVTTSPTFRPLFAEPPVWSMSQTMLLSEIKMPNPPSAARWIMMGSSQGLASTAGAASSFKISPLERRHTKGGRGGGGGVEVTQAVAAEVTARGRAAFISERRGGGGLSAWWPTVKVTKSDPSEGELMSAKPLVAARARLFVECLSAVCWLFAAA